MNFLKDTDQYDYLMKLIILGKDLTGKSSFLTRIKSYDNYKSFKDFTVNYFPTIGIDFGIICIQYNNKIFKFQIWDTSSQERFKSITKSYYNPANYILIFYDALDKESFEKAKVYYEEALNVNNKAIYFLIRSKYDLISNSHNNEIVSDEEALKFADKNNLIFTHISSFEKEENGINEVFEIIMKIEYKKS